MTLKTRVVPVLAALLVPIAACSADQADAQERADTEPAHGKWRETIEVATGGGHRGPWRMNRSDWRFVDDPTVAINDDGFIGVAWADHVKQDILFQLFDPEGQPLREEPINISGSPDIFSWLPRMIITRGESADDIDIYVLWQEIVFSGGSHGGEIYFARSHDGGRSFSSPRNLSNTTAGAGKGRQSPQSWHNGSLDLAHDADGTLYAAWTEYEGNLWFSGSTDGGESFSEPMHLAGEPGDKPTRGPTLAAARDGTVYLAWTVGEDDEADLRIATSDDRGRTFTTPRTIHERENLADAPKLFVDGDETIHLVYMERTGGMSGRGYVYYAQSRDEARTFSEPRRISSADRAHFQSKGFPSLDGDDAGNLYVLWERFPNPRSRPRGLALAISVDGGDSFTPAELVPGSDDPAHGFSGSQQGLLMRKLAVNSRGELAIVNSTFRSGHSSRITLYRGRAVIDRP